MEHPADEISSVVSLITTAVAPEIQQDGIQRYFTPDAGFRHPLCAVRPGPGSRERILGLYQWYRVMSPKIDLDVKSIVYDKPQGILILDVVQSFHIRLSPFKPAPSRLVVRLTLKEVDRLYYIAFQEDFYHPDDLMSLVVPPLAPLVRLALGAVGAMSNMCATVAHVLGISDIYQKCSGRSATDSAAENWESDSGLYDTGPRRKGD
ncbi:uncharacterized protein BT62DRAFT_881857 [Guyanagaster necrorhizus]|uniref:SigF-like NTF2-like domain-containing protein n=1 Tax=Guyanagaster necrorhizus TaxID=856835 RepID=A0A9P7W3M8_9AGAR|nr:uncharacterized protein BT62DRAFT_881857 [Guyanagaster necrorhizus MCA 3950]KAG7452038.1 hypothetical protein BT62DRAFT_881857 [Guyanagaster necrorhizus MCA 3950]